MEAYERFAEIFSSPFLKPLELFATSHHTLVQLAHTGAAGEPLQIEKLIHSAVSSSLLY
jgi:hypothetical protein